jgi:hypothetical protein
MNLHRIFNATIATAALILTAQLNPPDLANRDWTAPLLQRLSESSQNLDQLGAEPAIRNLG